MGAFDESAKHVAADWGSLQAASRSSSLNIVIREQPCSTPPGRRAARFRTSRHEGPRGAGTCGVCGLQDAFETFCPRALRQRGWPGKRTLFLLSISLSFSQRPQGQTDKRSEDPVLFSPRSPQSCAAASLCPGLSPPTAGPACTSFRWWLLWQRTPHKRLKTTWIWGLGPDVQVGRVLPPSGGSWWAGIDL